MKEMGTDRRHEAIVALVQSADARLWKMRAISRWSWALIALSSALQVLMFPIAGPVPLWRSALCWCSLAPFLVALLREQLTLRQAALLGYACGFLWYLGNCY